MTSSPRDIHYNLDDIVTRLSKVEKYVVSDSSTKREEVNAIPGVIDEPPLNVVPPVDLPQGNCSPLSPVIISDWDSQRANRPMFSSFLRWWWFKAAVISFSWIIYVHVSNYFWMFAWLNGFASFVTNCNDVNSWLFCLLLLNVLLWVSFRNFCHGIRGYIWNKPLSYGLCWGPITKSTTFDINSFFW